LSLRGAARDSVEWIVWTVLAGSEGAPVEGRAPGKTIDSFCRHLALIALVVVLPARRLWEGVLAGLVPAIHASDAQKTAQNKLRGRKSSIP
jgi:hypothetical protein